MTEGERIDQVISLRYPSYAIRHANHVCWLNHTMREYYDLWPRFSAGLGRAGRVKEGVRRRLLHAADRYLLTRNVRRLFVQSKTVQERLRIWPELTSTVLYPPPPVRPYRCDGYGDYVFMVSRLTPLKRAWAFGVALRRACDVVPERIALVGTGGISHWPATPDSGKINEAWDRDFLARWARNDREAMLDYTDAATYRDAGQGGFEIRTFIAVAAAARGKGEIRHYAPIPIFSVGCTVATMAIA